MKTILNLSIFLFASVSLASPRVDDDLRKYDDKIAEMERQFSAVAADPNDKDWVKKKIQHMYDMDQYMRAYKGTPYEQGYSDDEKKEFIQRFRTKFTEMDKRNTRELKDLLKTYRWFTRSEFDEQTDKNAWILVQHADLEPAFQKEILLILESLVLIGETSPANYGYLFDRVAASWSDPAQRKLQRYGTQGMCSGRNKWEPIPMESPAQIDRRRLALGMTLMSEYLALANANCP